MHKGHNRLNAVTQLYISVVSMYAWKNMFIYSILAIEGRIEKQQPEPPHNRDVAFL